MSKEDIQITESLKDASYITIALATPLIFLYVLSQRGVLPFDFGLSVEIPVMVLGVFLLFDIAFAFSVMDQWMD